MKRWWSVMLVWLGLQAVVCGQETVRIGLYQGLQFTEASASLISGTFDVLVDGISKGTVIAPLHLTANTVRGVLVSDAGHTWNGTHKVEFRARTGVCTFQLKPGLSGAKRQPYSGSLVVRHYRGKLVLINQLDVERYVAGVVEAETGRGRELEFYKAQAVISRTYALGNKKRHEKQGFHLCDQVHCQVYHGTARYDDLIPTASKATQGLVIVDADIELITAAFHANCGGQTVSSGYVWSKPLPYLTAVEDTFCLSMPSSHWEKRLPTADWDAYLKRKSSPGVTLPDTLNYGPNWQPADKTMYFTQDSVCIKLAEVRADLKLRSCWFSVHQEGSETVLIGRGFGHGVGMCQQGAIRRAERGQDFRDILHAYYTDVHVIPVSQIPFFKTPTLPEP